MYIICKLKLKCFIWNVYIINYISIYTAHCIYTFYSFGCKLVCSIKLSKCLVPQYFADGLHKLGQKCERLCIGSFF